MQENKFRIQQQTHVDEFLNALFSVRRSDTTLLVLHHINYAPSRHGRWCNCTIQRFRICTKHLRIFADDKRIISLIMQDADDNAILILLSQSYQMK